MRTTYGMRASALRSLRLLLLILAAIASARAASPVQEGPEYDWAGGTLAFSPDSRLAAFVAGRGRKDFAKPDQVFIVVDGREGPPYSVIMRKIAFAGGRAIHAIGLRMNAQTFEDEIVRIEMMLSANSSGPEETW
jgi:hypothetical protein